MQLESFNTDVVNIKIKSFLNVIDNTDKPKHQDNEDGEDGDS